MQLREQEFEDELNYRKRPIENNVLKRLYRILSMPTIDVVKIRDNPDVLCTVCLPNENNQDEMEKGCLARFSARFSQELVQKCNCRGFLSVAMKSVYFSSVKYRDMLIKISLQCRETDITSFVNSLDDMSKLFTTFNPTLNEYFEQCFTETKRC